MPNISKTTSAEIALRNHLDKQTITLRYCELSAKTAEMLLDVLYDCYDGDELSFNNDPRVQLLKNILVVKLY